MTAHKLPAIQWYVGDWLKDPQVASCSPETRGIWMDALMAMHENGRSGILTGTLEQLARICRADEEQMRRALAELYLTGTADVEISVENLCKSCGKPADDSGECALGEHHVTVRPAIVTLKNRRMEREASTRKTSKLRKRRQRLMDAVTQKSRSLSSSSFSLSGKRRRSDDDGEGENHEGKGPAANSL